MESTENHTLDIFAQEEQQQKERLEAAVDRSEVSLISEAFSNSLDVITQAECTNAEDNKEIPELEDTQVNAETDRQAAPPPVAQSTCPETQWQVGSPCKAVWSGDGQVYRAVIVCVDGAHCRIRFTEYENEEDVLLSALSRPDTLLSALSSPDTPLSALGSPDTPNQEVDGQWQTGSRCRATYSDGLMYPAEVLWVKGPRCRVRFDFYENEEELNVNELLREDELHGPRRRQNKMERETKEKKKNDGEKPAANHGAPFFPPFPPPPRHTHPGDTLSFVPPPPPVWSFGGKNKNNKSSDDITDDITNMLMLWYMCGFHTGSYMAQQKFQKSSSKE